MTGIKKKNISRENLIASKLSAKEDVKTYGFMKFSRLNYEFVNKKKSYSRKEISLSLSLLKNSLFSPTNFLSFGPFIGEIGNGARQSLLNILELLSNCIDVYSTSGYKRPSISIKQFPQLHFRVDVEILVSRYVTRIRDKATHPRRDVCARNVGTTLFHEKDINRSTGMEEEEKKEEK